MTLYLCLEGPPAHPSSVKSGSDPQWMRGESTHNDLLCLSEFETPIIFCQHFREQD
jgi:hypothetical protein